MWFTSRLSFLLGRTGRAVSLGTIVALGWVGEAPGQTTVRVLHYNIHRDIGGTDSNTAAQPALAKVINHLAPDVWTINELGGNSASYNAATAQSTLVSFINTRLTTFGPNPQLGQHFFIYLGTLTDGFVTSAIVSRYPFLSTQSYSDAGGGFSALRGLVSAKVNLPGPIELGVFTAHLKAFNSTNDAARRQAEANTNAGNLQNWLNANPGDGAVMTGDFNETEEPGENDNWSTGNVGDTLPNGVGTYRPVSTLRGVDLADARPVSVAGRLATIDAVSPTARFDYLLHRPSHLTFLNGSIFDTKQHNAAQLAALNSASGTNFVAGDSAAASDHLPVLEVFLASPGPALITTTAVSGLVSTAARLNASINANGLATTWGVELGVVASGEAVSIKAPLPATTSAAAVSFALSGLRPATTYRFRFVGQNSAGLSASGEGTFTTPAFLDADGDGLPNDWETAHGLNPNLISDALLDRDGDGALNRDEYAAGTAPGDAARVLRIASITQASTDRLIVWPSILGKRYQLQARSNLTEGAWVAVGGARIGTGGALSGVEPALGFPQRFYRVVTLP